MRVGLQAIGIGPGARPDVLVAIARAAEAAGFATLWAGEHVVLFEEHASRYPYAESGRFSVRSAADWLDPFAALAWAAAATTTIGLATGICLVPEHNPLILAKQVASLDLLSGGRFALGVGVGWMAEEFAALGVPFARRAQRTKEYVEVMRRLWREEATSFVGEFVRFAGARSFPKPVRGTVPVLLGGESDAALARAADYGDGWYGFHLSVDEAAERIAALERLLAARGRERASFRVVVAPFTKPCGTEELERYRALGVDELVLVEGPPRCADEVDVWIEDLVARFPPRA
jgi:probable F420-dependent oxidoreductase